MNSPKAASKLVSNIKSLVSPLQPLWIRSLHTNSPNRRPEKPSRYERQLGWIRDHKPSCSQTRCCGWDPRAVNTSAFGGPASSSLHSFSHWADSHWNHNRISFRFLLINHKVVDVQGNISPCTGGGLVQVWWFTKQGLCSLHPQEYFDMINWCSWFYGTPRGVYGTINPYVHITKGSRHTELILTVTIWWNTSSEVLQLGYSSCKKLSVITGRTCCSIPWQLGVNRSAGAFGSGFQKAERGKRASKRAATEPENLEVLVHCHHRVLNKENRSSSGTLFNLC